MLKDLATEPINTAERYDLCIIGAGAAGVTIARSMKHSGLKVCLLESGGKDYEESAQSMADGHSTGYDYYPLKESRLRFFGGTTAIWGGRCAELDEIDFLQRPWVASSGWPFTKDVLRPYYRQARIQLDIPPVENNACPGMSDPLKAESINTAYWQFDTQFDRFTLSKSQDLINHPNIQILLHATATKLVCNAEGNTIDKVEVTSPSGDKTYIEASKVVLATGGLEVPRLLLASNDVHPHGIGNRNDLVGRYFMEHPHCRAALIKTMRPQHLLSLLPRFIYENGARYGSLFHPSNALQQEEAILNSAFTLAIRKHPGEKQVMHKNLYNSMRHKMSPTKLGRSIWKITRKISQLVQKHFGSKIDLKKLEKREEYGIYAVVRGEQAPNPNSRITLTDEKDSLGMPKISLNWQFSEQDKHTILIMMKRFNRVLKQHSLGEVIPSDWLNNPNINWEVDPLVSNHPIAGYHHMGTTRMAPTPEEGVVDANCKVFGVSNLYIAGSSVFPTSGWANPTLTIIALALRLADHIKASRS